ncbi:hypothetical protein OX284_004015, partial [Flavobacterium sp. SUN046]|nr:hypothetical protein [Flavobacterium sp. SUN046]
MSISNCTVSAGNEIEFDVFVTNLISTDLRYNSNIIRFKHNTSILPSTGVNTETWGYVGGSDFPLSFPLTYPQTGQGGTFTYNTVSREFSISTLTGVYDNLTCSAPIIPAGSTKKLGRFVIHNSQNFVQGQPVGLIWSGTTSAVIMYSACGTITATYNNAATRTLIAPCVISIPSCATSAIASVTTNVTCHGGNDGIASVNLSPSPSEASITYTVDGGASQNATLTSGSFNVTGLTAGSHSIVISNSICSNLSTSVTISEPSVLTNTATITACDSYTWSVNGQTYTTGGTYTGTSTNGQGCTVNETLVLTVNSSSIFYADADADGYGNSLVTSQACVQPTGYVSNSTDCNDADATAHAMTSFYIDADADGYDNGTQLLCASIAPTGYVASTLGADCNDLDATAHSMTSFYVDADADGYGNGTELLCASIAPTGYVAISLGADCNDLDATAHSMTSFYVDADADGYGNGTELLCASVAPTGYTASTLGADCNDNDASTHQTAIYYVDADGDGYGAGSASLCASVAPTGYVAISLGADCNDNDASAYQTATLYVDVDGDGYDNGSSVMCYGTMPTGYTASTLGADCNDNDASTHQTAPYYVDADGDGYGAGLVSLCASVAPTGYVAISLGADCNDNDASAYQTATLYVDVDGDGYDNGSSVMC